MTFANAIIFTQGLNRAFQVILRRTDHFRLHSNFIRRRRHHLLCNIICALSNLVRQRRLALLHRDLVVDRRILSHSRINIEQSRSIIKHRQRAAQAVRVVVDICRSVLLARHIVYVSRERFLLLKALALDLLLNQGNVCLRLGKVQGSLHLSEYGPAAQSRLLIGRKLVVSIDLTAQGRYPTLRIFKINALAGKPVRNESRLRNKHVSVTVLYNAITARGVVNVVCNVDRARRKTARHRTDSTCVQRLLQGRGCILVNSRYPQKRSISVLGYKFLGKFLRRARKHVLNDALAHSTRCRALCRTLRGTSSDALDVLSNTARELVHTELNSTRANSISNLLESKLARLLDRA